MLGCIDTSTHSVIQQKVCVLFHCERAHAMVSKSTILYVSARQLHHIHESVPFHCKNWLSRNILCDPTSWILPSVSIKSGRASMRNIKPSRASTILGSVYQSIHEKAEWGGKCMVAPLKRPSMAIPMLAPTGSHAAKRRSRLPASNALAIGRMTFVLLPLSARGLLDGLR